ncbi:hypothetical protein LCGC14_1918220, partial [marine sediment metagenome]
TRLYNKISNNCFEYVKKYHSIEKIGINWIKILNKLVDK